MGSEAPTSGSCSASDWVTPPFDVVRIAHVELVVTDLAASREFYVDMLGLVADRRDVGRDLSPRLRGASPSQPRPPRRPPSRSSTTSRTGCARRPTSTRSLAATRRSAASLERGGRRARPGPGDPRCHDPLGFPVEFFHEMAEVGLPPAALRHLPRRSDHARRPREPLRPRCDGGLRAVPATRVSLLRVHRPRPRRPGSLPCGSIASRRSTTSR